jgi:hypothetical protein
MSSSEIGGEEGWPTKSITKPPETNGLVAFDFDLVWGPIFKREGRVGEAEVGEVG